MRIVKRGQLPETRIHEATCTHCQTVIEFKQQEAKISFDQRDGNYMTIDCPMCKRTIYKQMSTNNGYLDR